MQEANEQLKQLIHEFRFCFTTHNKDQRIEIVEVLYPVLLRFIRRDFSNLDTILAHLVTDTLSEDIWTQLAASQPDEAILKHDVIQTISLVLFNICTGLASASTLVESPHLRRIKHVVHYLLSNLRGVNIQTMNAEGQRFIELTLNTLSMILYPGYPNDVLAVFSVFLTPDKQIERSSTIVSILNDICSFESYRSITKHLSSLTTDLQKFMDSVQTDDAYYTLANTLLSHSVPITVKPTSNIAQMLLIGSHITTDNLASALTYEQLTPQSTYKLSQYNFSTNEQLSQIVQRYIMSNTLEQGYVVAACKLLKSLATEISDELINYLDIDSNDLALSQLVAKYSDTQIKSRYEKIKINGVSRYAELSELVLRHGINADDLHLMPLHIPEVSMKILMSMGTEAVQYVQILKSDEKAFIDQQTNQILTKMKSFNDQEKLTTYIGSFAMSSSSFTPTRNAGIKIMLHLDHQYASKWLESVMERVLDTMAHPKLYPIYNIEELPNESIDAKVLAMDLSDSEKAQLSVYLDKYNRNKKEYIIARDQSTKDLNNKLWTLIDPIYSWSHFYVSSVHSPVSSAQVMHAFVQKLDLGCDPFFIFNSINTVISTSSLSSTFASAEYIQLWSTFILKAHQIEENFTDVFSSFFKIRGLMSNSSENKYVGIISNLWLILATISQINFNLFSNDIAECLISDVESNIFDIHNAAIKAMLNFPLFTRKTAFLEHNTDASFIFNRQFFAYDVRMKLRKALDKLISTRSISAFFSSIIIGEEAPDATKDSEFPVYLPPSGVDSDRVYEVLSHIFIGRLKQQKGSIKIIRWLSSLNVPIVSTIVSNLAIAYDATKEKKKQVIFVQIFNDFIKEMSRSLKSSACTITRIAANAATSTNGKLRSAAYELSTSLVSYYSEPTIVRVIVENNQPLIDILSKTHTEDQQPTNLFKFFQASLSFNAHDKVSEIIDAFITLLSYDGLSAQTLEALYESIDLCMILSYTTESQVTSFSSTITSRLENASKSEKLRILDILDKLSPELIVDKANLTRVLAKLVRTYKGISVDRLILSLSKFIDKNDQSVVIDALSSIASKLSVNNWDDIIVNTLRNAKTTSDTFNHIFSYLDRIIVHQNELVLAIVPKVELALDDINSIGLDKVETTDEAWILWRLILIQLVRLLSSEVKTLSTKAFTTLKSINLTLSASKYIFDIYNNVISSEDSQAARYAIMLLANTPPSVAPYIDEYRSFIERLSDFTYSDHKDAFNELYEADMDPQFVPLFYHLSLFTLFESRANLWVQYVDLISKFVPVIATKVDFKTYSRLFTNLASYLKVGNKYFKAITRLISVFAQNLYVYGDGESLIDFVQDTIGSHVKPGCHPDLIKAVCSVFVLSPKSERHVFSIIQRMISGIKSSEDEARKVASSSLVYVIECTKFSHYTMYTIKNLCKITESFYPFTAAKTIRAILESYRTYVTENPDDNRELFTDLFSTLKDNLFSLAFGEYGSRRSNPVFQKKAPEVTKNYEDSIISIASRFSTLSSIKIFFRSLIDLLQVTDNQNTISSIKTYIAAITDGIRYNTSVTLDDIYDWYTELTPQSDDTVSLEDKSASKLRRGNESLDIQKSRRLAADHAFSITSESFSNKKAFDAVKVFIINSICSIRSQKRTETTYNDEIMTLAIENFGDSNAEVSISSLSLIITLDSDILSSQASLITAICTDKLSSLTLRKSHSKTLLSALEKSLIESTKVSSNAFQSVELAAQCLKNLLTIYNEQADESEVISTLSCLNKIYSLSLTQRLCPEGPSALSDLFLKFVDTTMATFINTHYSRSSTRTIEYLFEYFRTQKLSGAFRLKHFNIIIKALAGDNYLAKENSITLLQGLFKALNVDSISEELFDTFAISIPVIWSRELKVEQKSVLCNVVYIYEEQFFTALLNKVFAVSPKLSVIAHTSMFMHDYVSLIPSASIPQAMAVSAFTNILSHQEKGLLKVATLRYTDVSLATACISFLGEYAPFKDLLIELISISSFKGVVDNVPDSKLRLATSELFGKYLSLGYYDLVNHHSAKDYISNLYLIQVFDETQREVMDQFINTVFTHPEAFDPHNDDVTSETLMGYCFGPMLSCITECSSVNSDVLITIVIYFTITAIRALPESVNEYTVRKIIEPLARLNDRKHNLSVSRDMGMKIDQAYNGVQKLMNNAGRSEMYDNVISSINSTLLELSYSKKTRKIAQRVKESK